MVVWCFKRLVDGTNKNLKFEEREGGGNARGDSKHRKNPTNAWEGATGGASVAKPKKKRKSRSGPKGRVRGGATKRFPARLYPLLFFKTCECGNCSEG